MYKNKSTRSAGCVDGAKAPLGYVETDPSGRYGRVSFSLFFSSYLMDDFIWKICF